MVQLLPAQVFWWQSQRPTGSCRAMFSGNISHWAMCAISWSMRTNAAMDSTTGTAAESSASRSKRSDRKEEALRGGVPLPRGATHGSWRPLAKNSTFWCSLDTVFCFIWKGLEYCKKACMPMTLATTARIRKFFELECLTPMDGVGLKDTLKCMISPFDIPPCIKIQVQILIHQLVSYTWLQLILPKENKATTNR